MEPRRQTVRPTFIPRATLTILAGFALFVVVCLGYSLPVLMEEPPPGAIEDYTAERVRERLQGKVMWFLGGSILATALGGALLQRDRD